MAARKRDKSESLKEYHENLKNEKRSIRTSLAGKVLWPSVPFGTAHRVILDGKPYFVDEYGKNRVRLA